MPSPAGPWHRAQLAAYTRAPAAVSGTSEAHLASRLEDGGTGATGTSRARNQKYVTMSRMSGPSLASGVPFMLRRKQSFTRYSIVSTVALRGRYCG